MPTPSECWFAARLRTSLCSRSSPGFQVTTSCCAIGFGLREWILSGTFGSSCCPLHLLSTTCGRGKLTVFAQGNRGTPPRHSPGRDGWLRRACRWLQNIPRKFCSFAMKFFIGSQMVIRHCAAPFSKQAASAMNLRIDTLLWTSCISTLVFPIPKEVLINSLVGPFNTGIADLEGQGPFVIFNRGDANSATRERAQWCLETVIETGALIADFRTRKRCLDAFLDEHDTGLVRNGAAPSSF